MSRPFDDLRAKMSPERRAASEARAKEMLAEMQNQPSLVALLMAVERLQEFDTGMNYNSEVATYRAMMDMDVAELRRLAHQHAEALRAFARVADEIERPVLHPATSLRAAADFLDGEKA